MARPQANVHKAVAVLKKKIAEWDALTEVKVDIHPDIHRRIIGAKGANILALQAKFGVKINFPEVWRDPPFPTVRSSNTFSSLSFPPLQKKGASTVTIVGPAPGAEDCKEELLNIEEEFIQDVQEREELARYQAKPAPAPKAAAAPGAFQVRDAPWTAATYDAKALFPNLGASAAPAKPLAGAWGLKH